MRTPNMKKIRGIKGALRKLWRKMGQHAGNAGLFRELIPDVYRLGTVRAGLGLCFQVRSVPSICYIMFLSDYEYAVFQAGFREQRKNLCRF